MVVVSGVRFFFFSGLDIVKYVSVASSIYFTRARFFSVQPLCISVRDCVIPRGAVSLLRRKVAARSSGKRISLFESYPLLRESCSMSAVQLMLQVGSVCSELTEEVVKVLVVRQGSTRT